MNDSHTPPPAPTAIDKLILLAGFDSSARNRDMIAAARAELAALRRCREAVKSQDPLDMSDADAAAREAGL